MSAILVAGGARDPNLVAVIKTLQEKGIVVVPLLIDAGENPALHWNLNTADIVLNHTPLACSGVFLRRDVFHENDTDAAYRAAAWFAAIQGWLLACPQVRILNRAYLGKHTNKLQVLQLARQAGLLIPDTLISNDINNIELLNKANELVAKPVTGGGYCQSIDALLSETELQDGISATPAIVQHNITGPDVRIYAVDDQFLGFQIHADKIDYRESRNRHIETFDPLPERITEAMRHLMTKMGLDWCAADFKLDPKSGQFFFLEINSNPMFSAFDKVAHGAITGAIADFLTISA
jgi:glutathione synthase/RimK-type ligase-like ATP-grasp enzyme